MCTTEQDHTDPAWRVFIGLHGEFAVFDGPRPRSCFLAHHPIHTSPLTSIAASPQQLSLSVSNPPAFLYTSTTNTIRMVKLLLKTALALVVLVQLSSNSSATHAAKSCERDCEANVSPICASDGVTYANACLFDQAHCFDNELLPMHYGACSN